MIGVGAAAALVAGVVRGKDTRERAVFLAAFVVAEAGIIVATSLYTQGRSSVWNFELLLPLALGAVPGSPSISSRRSFSLARGHAGDQP